MLCLQEAQRLELFCFLHFNVCSLPPCLRAAWQSCSQRGQGGPSAAHALLRLDPDAFTSPDLQPPLAHSFVGGQNSRLLDDYSTDESDVGPVMPLAVSVSMDFPIRYETVT